MMKLFIFEPYSWAHCGGAIGIIAGDFDQAVETIIKEDIEQGSNRIYQPEHFQRDKSKFKKDHFDQWLLTSETPLAQVDEPEVLFDNWNYG